MAQQQQNKSVRTSASSSPRKENGGRADPSPALVHKQPARTERPIPLSPNGAKAPHSKQPMHLQIDPPPHAATPYLPLIRKQEEVNEIPHNLLARLLEQESDFNPKAHNTRTDAQGMAQIVPRWHPNTI